MRSFQEEHKITKHVTAYSQTPGEIAIVLRAYEKKQLPSLRDFGA